MSYNDVHTNTNEHGGTHATRESAQPVASTSSLGPPAARSGKSSKGNGNGSGSQAGGETAAAASLRKRKFTVEERKGHSVVEKRRRENLNAKLLILARNLPTLSEKSSKRLSKNLIIQAAIDHVLAERQLLLEALPQLRDLLEEHDELHKENDSWRNRAGLQPHPRDRKDEAHIRELFVVEQYSYSAFAHGFAMVDRDDGDEDEVPPAPATFTAGGRGKKAASAVTPTTTTPLSPNRPLPPALPVSLHHYQHQHPAQHGSPTLPFPNPAAHPPPPIYDDNAFVMNNFHYLGQHQAQLIPPPHSPAAGPPLIAPSTRSLSNQSYYPPELHSATQISHMPPHGITESPILHDSYGVTGTVGSDIHHNAVGVGTSIGQPQAGLPNFLTGFGEPVDFSQFPASSSNLDFLLHWPTSTHPGESSGQR